MRLKSAIFVSALLRRASVEGAFAVVARRGAEEAGAIFVKVTPRDGTAALYGPAPQTAFDEAFPAARKFAVVLPPGSPEADVDARLARELKYDPDIYVVEIEDRAGRHFLDIVPA